MAKSNVVVVVRPKNGGYEWHVMDFNERVASGWKRLFMHARAAGRFAKRRYVNTLAHSKCVDASV